MRPSIAFENLILLKICVFIMLAISIQIKFRQDQILKEKDIKEKFIFKKYKNNLMWPSMTCLLFPIFWWDSAPDRNISAPLRLESAPDKKKS